jgi:hypothetical protein
MAVQFQYQDFSHIRASLFSGPIMIARALYGIGTEHTSIQHGVEEKCLAWVLMPYGCWLHFTRLQLQLHEIGTQAKDRFPIAKKEIFSQNRQFYLKFILWSTMLFEFCFVNFWQENIRLIPLRKYTNGLFPLIWQTEIKLSGHLKKLSRLVE